MFFERVGTRKIDEGQFRPLRTREKPSRMKGRSPCSGFYRVVPFSHLVPRWKTQTFHLLTIGGKTMSIIFVGIARMCWAMLARGERFAMPA